MTKDTFVATCIVIAALIGIYFAISQDFLTAGQQNQKYSWLHESKNHQYSTQNSTPHNESTDNKNKDDNQNSNTNNDITNIIQAISAAVSAGFGVAIYFVYRRQAGIMERQTSIMERQAGNERPWLFVNNFGITRREPPPVPNAWYINIEWRNVGRMPAIIDECVIKFSDIQKMPPTPDYAGAAQLTVERVCGVGNTFRTNDIGVSYRPTADPVIQYVAFGRLTYHELSGASHQTGFAVQVAPHFIATNGYGNPAYEYWN